MVCGDGSFNQILTTVYGEESMDDSAAPARIFGFQTSLLSSPKIQAEGSVLQAGHAEQAHVRTREHHEAF